MRAVVYRRKMEFGVAKVVFDVSMTVIAAGLSVCLQGKLSGVREGTIIAAVSGRFSCPADRTKIGVAVRCSVSFRQAKDGLYQRVLNAEILRQDDPHRERTIRKQQSKECRRPHPFGAKMDAKR